MTVEPRNAIRASNELPIIQRVISVLWPSFLAASAATILFFTLFDPVDLAGLTRFSGVSRQAGYTLGFFAFWLLTAVSSAMTCYFRRPCSPPSPHANPDPH